MSALNGSKKVGDTVYVCISGVIAHIYTPQNGSNVIAVQLPDRIEGDWVYLDMNDVITAAEHAANVQSTNINAV